jgi:hypothetical protein
MFPPASNPPAAANQGIRHVTRKRFRSNIHPRMMALTGAIARLAASNRRNLFFSNALPERSGFRTPKKCSFYFNK